MTDYISREAAFKEFAEFVRGSNNSDFLDAPTWNDAVSLIGSLPAADVVEVVRGEWKPCGHYSSDTHMICECSVCGDTVWVYYNSEREWNYCPNCGAKMKG